MKAREQETKKEGSVCGKKAEIFPSSQAEGKDEQMQGIEARLQSQAARSYIWQVTGQES
jgi:hypothetical protein